MYMYMWHAVKSPVKCVWKAQGSAGWQSRDRGRSNSGLSLENSISLSKLVGLGSDCAAVMIGRVSGVSIKLIYFNKFMKKVFCAGAV